MITRSGYSKDQSIQPDGIAITWVEKKLIDWYGNMEVFERYLTFKMNGSGPGGIWFQEMRTGPKHDILYVYIIISGIVRYRLNFIGYENGHLMMSGPVMKAPFEVQKKGFQGFRYTTKLF